MTETLLRTKKADLRKLAFAQRKAAKDEIDPAPAQKALVEFVLAQKGVRVVSAYMAIQSEIDPIDAMYHLHNAGLTVAVPVIQGRDMPLLFRQWSPDAAMIEGDFGALIPRGGELVVPDLIVAPLVAFDHAGNRMGYGGGFYDRSVEQLRKSGDLITVGFAYSAQEMPVVPTEPTDQRLDAVVTERGTRRFA